MLYKIMSYFDDIHTATKLKKIYVTCEDNLKSFETIVI